MSDVESGFRDILLTAFDEGLDSIGKNFKDVILFHVKQRTSLTLDDFPAKPQEFMSAISGILGEGSVRVLERIIVTRLDEIVGVPFEEKPGRGLVEYVEEAKRVFLKNRGEGLPRGG